MLQISVAGLGTHLMSDPGRPVYQNRTMGCSTVFIVC